MDPVAVEYDDFPEDYFEEEEEEEAEDLRAGEAPEEESVMSSSSSWEAVKEEENPRVVTISPFLELIADAILTLNNKSGSSLAAILKHIQKKYGDMPHSFEEGLRTQLKRFLKEGKIHCGRVHKRSYKLSKKAPLSPDLAAKLQRAY